ncbi:hypothetical protein [Alkalilimnicola ehrlichii]|uniref:hypothetical protein n=1 Tax=Alkalilimnicola ehrlichii TaxID=351052 RepID=UPI003BA339B2
MMRTRARPKRNSKRRLHPELTVERRRALAQCVKYVGSPLHKRNPGDFGLTPPVAARPGKSLCDDVSIFERDKAQVLLREGVQAGLVSRDADEGFPRHIWMVHKGRVIEARCDNMEAGTYHGYPLEADDPMADAVRREWSRRQAE